MKLSRQQIRKLILEVIQPKEIKEKEIKKAVRKCLEQEGGAAGIDLLIKAVKKLESKSKKLPKKIKNDKQISKYIMKMKFVGQHKYDDIILKPGSPKGKK